MSAAERSQACLSSFLTKNPRLVTLALQNALLAIIMHHSRISTPPSKAYSSSSAVLLSEILKGAISFVVAYTRVDEYDLEQHPEAPQRRSSFVGFSKILDRFKRLGRHILGPDCWKLSIPAILYGMVFFLLNTVLT